MERKQLIGDAEAILNLLAKVEERFGKYIDQLNYDTIQRGERPEKYDLLATRVVNNVVMYLNGGISYKGLPSAIEMMHGLSSIILPLYTWKHSKRIYKFDDDTAKLLRRQKIGDMKMNNSLFMHIPANGMCIIANIFGGLRAIFVCRDNLDVHTFQEESDTPIIDFALDFFVLDLSEYKRNITSKNSDISLERFVIAIREGKSFTECINDGFTSTYAKDRSPGEIRTIILQCLNLLMYICADNADIIESDKPTPVNLNSNRSKQYKEVKQADVGINIGRAIRKIYTVSVSGNTSHKTKTPHFRSGHWQRYWIGPRNDPEKRKQITHWVAPIFVNGFTGDNKSTNIRPIEE